MGLKKHAEHCARLPPLATLAGGANRGWQQGIQADPSSERHGIRPIQSPRRPRSRTRRRPLGQRGGLGNKGSILAPWIGDFTSLLGRGTSAILREIGPWNIGKKPAFPTDRPKIKVFSPHFLRDFLFLAPIFYAILGYAAGQQLDRLVFWVRGHRYADEMDPKMDGYEAWRGQWGRCFGVDRCGFR